MMNLPAVRAYFDVRERIARAVQRAGRKATDVTLIAVSKTFAAHDIAPVIAAGQRHFGENRVQEMAAKWPELLAESPDLKLHLIGPLQTNKLAQALKYMDVLHTLDRLSLAQALRAALPQHPKPLSLLVQVNTGYEPQKAGVSPDVTDEFIKIMRQDYGLNIAGLMCIPPVGQDPAPHFKMLAQIAGRNGISQLSMGMSHDFETAIAHGATHVRVGSAIFGAR